MSPDDVMSARMFDFLANVLIFLAYDFKSCLAIFGFPFGILVAFHSAFLWHFIRYSCGISFGILAAGVVFWTLLITL